MIILAESGSTKTDWRIWHNAENQFTIVTDGFNPNYHHGDVLAAMIEEVSRQTEIQQADSLFFYGSGCSSPAAVHKVVTAVNQVLPDVKVEVQHDLFGAARALFGSGTGFASILGTGSSSCFFENGKIGAAVPSLGFLLGDEGSGMQLGSLLLNAYFKKRLPGQLHDTFEKRYALKVGDFITQLYSHPKPNSMIASYVPFLFEFKNEPAVKELVATAFEDFITKIILNYSNCREHELGFVGSVAFLFRDILSEVILNHQLRLGKIIQNPIEELVRYHTRGL